MESALRAGGVEPHVVRTRSIDDAIEALLADQDKYDEWVQAEKALMDSYRRSAHEQDPAPRMPEALTEPTRARLRAALEAGEEIGSV